MHPSKKCGGLRDGHVLGSEFKLRQRLSGVVFVRWKSELNDLIHLVLSSFRSSSLALRF